MIRHQFALEGATEHCGFCLETLQLPGPGFCLAAPTSLAAGDVIHLEEGPYSQLREGSSGVRGELIDTTP